MAKGQVTDADLATGIKGFGGLGSLGGTAPRPVRDNPFRDTRAEAPRPVAVAPAVEPVPETPKLEVLTTTRAEPEGEGREVAPAAAVVPAPLKARQTRSAVTPRTPKKDEPAPVLEEAKSGAPGRENKTEVYTERVTVLLNAELRDGAEALAKELHRRRTKKGERITANTVMRVALRVLLDRMEDEDLEGANSEEELLAAVRKLFAIR